MKSTASNYRVIALVLAAIYLPIDAIGLLEKAHAQPQAAAAQKQKQPIRIQTDLVNILASVVDADGEPVIGLPHTAFQLFEENVEQKIVRFGPQTNRPLDLALLVDTSGSATIELKIERDAAERFVKEVVRPDDRVAGFSFTSEVVQLCNFSSDPKGLENAVRRGDTTPGMGAAPSDAVVLGSQAVKRQGAERRRALVIITDAGETTSVSKFDATRRAGVASGGPLVTGVGGPMKARGGGE